MSERISDSGFIPRWVRHEHQARYAFAARYAEGKGVLDCACGDGTGSSIFLKAGAQRLYGFDASPEAVAKARARCPQQAAQFQRAEAARLPLPDQAVELYISLETIEHVEQDRAFLAEAARVLKPEGIFLCSTPNRTVTNPGAVLRDKPWNRFHVREYNREEFLERLGSTFGKVELFGQNPKSPGKVRLMSGLGEILPFHGAVWVNQFLKFPALFLDRLEDHAVNPWRPGTEPEYWVAVCRNPKRG